MKFRVDPAHAEPCQYCSGGINKKGTSCIFCHGTSLTCTLRDKCKNMACPTHWEWHKSQLKKANCVHDWKWNSQESAFMQHGIHYDFWGPIKDFQYCPKCDKVGETIK